MNQLSRVSRLSTQAEAAGRSRPIRVLVVAVLAVSPLLVMLLQLDRLLDPDHGVYAAMARLLLDGGVPYRDLFDNKPPLQYAWFSAGLAVFGDNVESLQLTAGIFMSATAALVFTAGRLLFTRSGGYVALAVFAASQALVPGITDALPETIMLLPHTAALVAVLYGLRSGQRGWFLASGLLFGLAVLSKPVAVWPAVALLPALMLLLSQQTVGAGPTEPHRANRRIALSAGALYVAGGITALLVVLAPFAVWGALPELTDSLVTFNLELSSQLTYGERASNLGDSLLRILGSPGLTLLLGTGVLGLLITAAAPRRLEPSQRLFLVFAVATIFGMATTGYFFLHHYVQLFPILAIAAAGGVSTAPHVLASPRRRLSAVAALVLFVALPASLASAVSAARTVPTPNEDPSVATVPVDRRLNVSDEAFLAAWDQRNVALGTYLRSRTSEDDLIHVHGATTSRAPVYFYAKRDPAARYFFGRGLRVRPSELPVLIEELRAARPLFIVDTFGPDYRYNPTDDFDARSKEFLALLDEHYELVDTVHFADVYRLITPDR